MYVTELAKALDAARRVLAKDDLVKAKKMIEQATGGAPDAAKLLAALSAQMALEALDGDPVMLFAFADDNARSYWDSPGPYRSCAITIRILARLGFADWLASTGDAANIKLANEKIAEAITMSLTCSVAGIDVVAKRVQAAARQTQKQPGTKARKLRPRAKPTLARAKSWKRGTLDAKDLMAFAKLVKRAELNEMARSMDDYDGDAFLWEGDLVIDGDFRTTDADVTVLVVHGNLVISGLYDAPNEHSFVIVTGSMRAGDIITASSLDVIGDVEAAGVIIGDYNDGGAHVRGNLRAQLFAPTDHPFRVDGKVSAAHVLADGRCKPKKGETPWNDLPLVAPLELDDVIGRLRNGLPILRPR